MVKRVRTSRDLQKKIDLGIKEGIYSAAELDRDILELEKLLEEESYQLAEKSLYEFFKLAWNWYDPNPLVDNWHLECVCEHVQAALDRQIRRLIVNISPRSSKSTIGSISSVAWQLLRKPEEKFWLISHSHKLFMQNIVYTRRIFDHPGYKDRWLDPNSPNYRFSLTKDQNTKTRIETTQGGFVMGGSPTSGALGMGYTVAVLDDILDSQESNNPDLIEKVNLWYTQTFMNRSNDVNNDVVILLMQRLASNDISGYVEKEYGDQGWFKLLIPAKYDPDRTFISPIGFNDKRTKRNELMDPIRLPDSFLETQAKNKVVYNTRYQQNPDALTDGNMIEGEWIIETDKIPHKFDALLTVWDLSFADDPESSYSVGLVMGKHEDKIYIFDMYRKRMNAPQQTDAVRKMKAKYKDSQIGIEKRANGSAVMSFLEREIHNIYAFQPRLFGGSKEQRLNACLTYFRDKRVLIYSPFEVDDKLEPTYSAETIKKELLQFPIGEHDDIVDCVSYGVQYLMEFGQEGLAIITNGEKIILSEEDINMREWLKTGKSSILSSSDIDFTNSDDIFSSMPTRDYILEIF